jgi:hypothetical protein
MNGLYPKDSKNDTIVDFRLTILDLAAYPRVGRKNGPANGPVHVCETFVLVSLWQGFYLNYLYHEGSEARRSRGV